MTRKIDGKAKTIRELLDSCKYKIDFYQREYAWREKQVQELVDDLSGKFLDFYSDEHERHEVESYGHYFLGSIVISHKKGHRYIVDGQQRLTTLTLFLMMLKHMTDETEYDQDITKLIYSIKYGTKSFNIDVEERNDIMKKILDKEFVEPKGENESVDNIIARYQNLEEFFPEELKGRAFPFFMDWFLENVHLVEIEAYSDEDAYTIFETMNDRGLSLSLSEMLKGYILANIHSEDDQRKVNSIWKEDMLALKEFGKEYDLAFFRNWLRAQYAETIRPGSKGSENKDYERIGREFHRWIRDHKSHVGLEKSSDFVRFVLQELHYFVQCTLEIRQAVDRVVEGLESVFYLDNRGFTLFSQLMLAPLMSSESKEVALKKMKMVADFLDIWVARRVWNFRTISYSSIKYTLFSITKRIRHLPLSDLSVVLQEELEKLPEHFHTQPRLRLHKQNYRQIRHILARITHFVDAQSGLSSHFEDLVTSGRGRPFEVEHIWANHYQRFSDVFGHPTEFTEQRNQIGALLLLRSGLNQSLSDNTYEEKIDAYATKGENLVTRSLHDSCYLNNPGFRQFIEKTGLPFKPYAEFNVAQIQERQILYIRIAEWVWNPSRLSLNGITAPEHQPVTFLEETKEEQLRGDRHKMRKMYWDQFLELAKVKSDFHGHLSSTNRSYIGCRKLKHEWNFALNLHQVRAELYIDRPLGHEVDEIYDALYQNKTEIEASFGGELIWQRLEGKRAARVCYTVDGGWVNETSWKIAHPQVIVAMNRLYKALQPYLEE